MKQEAYTVAEGPRDALSQLKSGQLLHILNVLQLVQYLMTAKVIQGHQNCYHSISHIYLPISV